LTGTLFLIYFLHMKITYQNYGSSILLFVNAESDEVAYGKYLSLWNWNCTSSEASHVKDGVIACWSTIERLKNYLFRIRVMQLIASSPKKGVKGGVAKDAHALAEQDFLVIEHEQYRSVNSSGTEYGFGCIDAEKPDDDFKDSVLKYAFAN